MPNSTRKSLVRVLLWWVTVLSISQVVLLVLFLTMGHYGQSHNGAEQVGTNQTSGNRGQSSSSKPGVSRMFTFKATRVLSNRCINWYAIDPDSEDLPIVKGELGVLNIKADGDFLMCLRITEATCNKCEDKGTKVDGVNLVNQYNESILFGSINKITRSTGLLCKMKSLSAAAQTLKVEIQTKLEDPSEVMINVHLNMTYLDVFFMPSVNKF